MTQLNFKDIDRFREAKLKISSKDMAALFGVSRISYYKWVKGETPGPTNRGVVHRKMRNILKLIVEDQWPPPELAKATMAARYESLVAGLAEIEKE